MKISASGLIDISELKKEVRRCDMLIWADLPDGKAMLASGQWIAVLQRTGAYSELASVLYGIFGRIPRDGECLKMNRTRGKYADKQTQVMEHNPLGTYFCCRDIPVRDTRLSFEGKVGSVRLFVSGSTVIAIANRYYDLLAERKSGIIEVESHTTPIVFESDTEKLLVMPVNMRIYSDRLFAIVQNLDLAV